jgi:hypothetical protein
MLKKIIQEKRPNISKSSINTYNSILTNLYKRIFGNGEIDINKFDDDKEILTDLNNLEPNKRKTVLSALVVVTDNKKYRDQMLDDIKEYRIETAKQVKTKSQEDNWVEDKELDDIFFENMMEYKYLLKKKIHSSSELQKMQNFIILCLLSGKFIPPRRLKDFVDFKINDIDTEDDNFLLGRKFIFNSYKTAKTYGRQEVEVPTKLYSILKQWIKINPTDFLLFDSKGEQLTNVKLNQRLNKIFKKEVSVNILRHMYLSGKYGDLIETKKKLNQDFKDMGSSMGQEQVYIKKT